MGDFIPKVLKKSVPRALTLLSAVLIAVFAIPGLTILEAETLPILALTITGFVNLIWLCIPFTWYRVLIAFLSAGLIATAICVLPNMFGLARLADMAVFNPIVWISLSSIIAGEIILIGIYELVKWLILRRKKQS